MIVSILKIIGIVFLVIIALLIFIFGILLCSPVRYQFAGEYKDKADVDVFVKWSPVLLKVTVTYHNDKLEYVVRLLGGVIATNLDVPLSWLGKKMSPNVKEKENGDTEEASAVKQDFVVLEDEIEFDKPEKERVEKKRSPARARRKKQPFFVGLKNKIQRIKKKVKLWKDKLKTLNDKREALLKVYHSKRFEVAKRDAVCYLKSLWEIIRPKDLSGFVHFGFEDPATTGQVLGGLATCLIWYDSYVQVQPDFEQACLDGHISGKGKFRFFSIIRLIIKILLNKNLIKVIKKVQTIIEA